MSGSNCTTGDVTWTLSTTTGKGSPTTSFGTQNSQSCIKLGSGKNNYYSKMTLTTSAFSSYNVSSVVLYISSNNGGSKTIKVTQGSTTIGTGSQSFSSTTWVTGCTRNTTAGSGGDLTIEISSDATATFIHSIKVTYTASAASHTLSSAVSPAGGGSVSLSATSVAEGSTATATAEPATHYTFTSWSISGTGATLSSTTTNPTTVTMGTANATVTATFTAVPKASITLSEAGATTTDATTYYVGDTYTLPTTTSASCGTKVLVGWSTVAIPTPQNTKPSSNFYEKGASVTLAASQTFYAVFATASGSGTSNATVVFSGDNPADYQFSTGSDSEAGSLASVTNIAAGKIAISFSKGTASNWPFYDGSLVRFYKNANFTITPTDATITSVSMVRSTSSSSNGGTISTTGLTADAGNTTTNTNTYTGTATSAITFTNDAQCRFSSISVTYSYTSTTYSAYSTSCVSTYTVVFSDRGINETQSIDNQHFE